MKTVFFAQDKYVSPGFARRVSRFMTCESGATTAEFAIIASVVVALAAGVVTSTRDGAALSANNTASTLEAQAPMFDKLEDGQTAVKTAYNASAESEGSNYDAYNNPTPPAAGGAAPATGETQAPANASDEEAEQQQSAEQDTETNAEPEAGTETAEAPEAPEAAPKTEQPGEDVAGDDETNGTEPEEEEEVTVAEVVITGCENPYNKRGNIKKKCR